MSKNTEILVRKIKECSRQGGTAWVPLVPRITKYIYIILSISQIRYTPNTILIAKKFYHTLLNHLQLPKSYIFYYNYNPISFNIHQTLETNPTKSADRIPDTVTTASAAVSARRRFEPLPTYVRSDRDSFVQSSFDVPARRYDRLALVPRSRFIVNRSRVNECRLGQCETVPLLHAWLLQPEDSPRRRETACPIHRRDRFVRTRKVRGIRGHAPSGERDTVSSDLEFPFRRIHRLEALTPRGCRPRDRCKLERKEVAPRLRPRTCA
ncbi:uncharacterized protein LOC143178523 [Calliopsis andreniformis]|uniref:uncharacterized protein LOC143178523 n=1 Tax=Calliopsis andreniformis TaxID=337506 RepID=UPI003FCDA379